MHSRDADGFTLMELVSGMAIIAIAVTALLSVFVSQMVLNEHARNLSMAISDATRVMEQLRQQNSQGVCVVLNAAPPLPFATWDAWLANTTANGGGGKSVQPNPSINELVAVSIPAAPADPLRVTVAVCWRHRGRVLGECTWNGAGLTANPGAGGDLTVTESPAMLVTAITCRQ